MPVLAGLPDETVMRAIYLHGFASSAQSSKARYFRDRLTQVGVAVEVPDFNHPSFETLTVTRMLGQVVDAIGRSSEPVVLIGSSLGAFVAVHAAARARVERMVLLAPALDFAANRMRELGEGGLARWKSTGELEVFHYGFNRVMRVGYRLYEDAARYDAFALHLDTPTLIFQGARDAVVDPAVARRFSKGRPHVTVRLLDDDHQLLGSLAGIWEESRQFLGLPATPR